MLTVREIVKEWLEKCGYDGLAGDECGCPLDDLMPCEGFDNISSCVPAVKVPCDPETCPYGGDCEYHLVEAPIPKLTEVSDDKTTET